MLVLHSHIPYVKKQGRWPFGEVWLFEAMAETYIPLLSSWAHLEADNINMPLTLGLSPTLLEQVSSSYVKQEFVQYLKEREISAGEDERYFLSRGEKQLAETASVYRRFYCDIRRDFVIDFDSDLIRIIKLMQEKGFIEVITTAATHAYLPLMDVSDAENQVYWGKQVYRKHFDCEPRGFWLPECGYKKGLEDILAKHGFKYFYVDSHAIEGGKPLGIFSGEWEDKPDIETFANTGLSTYRPYKLEGTDITVFGRNAMVSHQVWSAEYGYPGDEFYREFHKQQPGSGFKYWRVTDRSKPLDKKVLYDARLAKLKARQHASHFVNSLRETGREAKKLGFAAPLIVGCYDTELFGHWWWEGVTWLESVLKEINASSDLTMVLPSELTCARHSAQIFDSSWGMGGKHFIWDNKETGWMWEIINRVGKEYEKLQQLSLTGDFEQRATTQALKELMLLQSSDWLFMVSNNLTRDYAMKRFFEHYTKFLRISDTLHNNKVDDDFIKWFAGVECEDDLFSCL